MAQRYPWCNDIRSYISAAAAAAAARAKTAAASESTTARALTVVHITFRQRAPYSSDGNQTDIIEPQQKSSVYFG